MPRFRQIDENTLAQVKRGDPQPCPEGFEPEKGDPYTCLRIWPPCEYRSAKDLKCCSGVPTIVCMLDIPIKSQTTCIGCEKRYDGNESPISM